MRCGRAQRGVKGEIGNPILFGQAGLDVVAALAVCLSLRTAAGFAAREAVELRIQAAGGKFLAAFNLLPAFPPLTLLGCLGDGLRARFCVRDGRFLALVRRV
ncbi:MAG: hypothetical protein ACK2UK_12760 [Candidatus Promineifilaceae bacterium]